jgi:hypothetical protein
MQRKLIAGVLAGAMLASSAGAAFAQDAAPAATPMKPGGAAGSSAAFISGDAALLGVAGLALAAGLAIALSGGHNSSTTTTTSTTGPS